MEAPETLVARVLGIAENRVTDELAFQSIPQWDSMNHMNLILAIEESYDVEIDPDTIVELTSVAAIREFAANRQ